jgi:hypothetical protein
MISPLAVSLLVFAITNSTRTNDIFRICAAGQGSIAPIVRSNEFATLFEVKLRAYSASKKAQLPDSTADASPPSEGSSNESSDDLLSENSDLPAEDFLFEYSPLTRKSRLSETRRFTWLPGWRLEEEDGLYYSFRAQVSRVAFRYSDIFETRANSDKGGHGPSIFFRYDLAKMKSSARRLSSTFR